MPTDKSTIVFCSPTEWPGAFVTFSTIRNGLIGLCRFAGERGCKSTDGKGSQFIFKINMADIFALHNPDFAEMNRDYW
jgi:hypothetical protein